MEEGIKFFVGLNVHKETIAVAEAGRAPARLVGGIAHDVVKLLKALARYGEAKQVQVVYEAYCTGSRLEGREQRDGGGMENLADADGQPTNWTDFGIFIRSAASSLLFLDMRTRCVRSKT